MKNDCRTARAVLAEGPLCKVEGCACGTVHVSVGQITLRLRPDAVESIWATLGEAIVGLHLRQEHEPATSKAHLS